MYSQQESPAHDRMRNTLRVGDAARRTRTVTVRDIELFTELTGDRNPLHYDPLLARRSRFGGIVVQGGVTSGLLKRQVRVEWELRHLIWIPDAICGAFSSGRSVVALIADLESAVLWWNILPMLGPPAASAFPAAAISACARRRGWSGTGRRASAAGAECRVAIGG
jgi:MaoC like domain